MRTCCVCELWEKVVQIGTCSQGSHAISACAVQLYNTVVSLSQAFARDLGFVMQGNVQMVSSEDYLALRLPWLRGRSWTRNVCLFLLYLVLYPPFACMICQGIVIKEHNGDLPVFPMD